MGETMHAAQRSAGIAGRLHAPLSLIASAASGAAAANLESTAAVNANSVTGLFHAAGGALTGSEAAQTPNPNTQFKPFVLVRIPYDKSTYTNGGDVMGVSNPRPGSQGDRRRIPRG